MDVSMMSVRPTSCPDIHQGSGGHLEIGDLRGAVQTAAGLLQRIDSRHWRRRVSATARLRGNQPETARGNAAVDRQGRSTAGALAVRPRACGGLHLRCEGKMGAGLARLAEVPTVLVPDRQVESGGWTMRISR